MNTEKESSLSLAARILTHEGVYICGDTQHPGCDVPLASVNGQIWSMKLDTVLAVSRFLPTATVFGPFRADMQGSGSVRIHEERQRQIHQEGWTAEHDDGHTAGELIKTAVAYADLANDLAQHEVSPNGQLVAPLYWPGDEECWKPSPDPIRNLEKAGALIAAEIDRLLRLRAAAEAASAETNPAQESA